MSSEEVPIGAVEFVSSEVPEAEDGSSALHETLANPSEAGEKAPAPAATTKDGIAIMNQGKLMLEAVINARESTALVDLAMSLVGSIPEKEAFGLAILELMKENQDADPPKKLNAIDDRIYDRVTDKMFENDEFDKWWENLETDESNPAFTFLFDPENSDDDFVGNDDKSDEDDNFHEADKSDGDDNFDEDEDYSDEDEDENEVNEDAEMNGVEPGIGGGAQPESARSDLPRRLQSKASQVADSNAYRERSRSPIDDGDKRD